MRTELFQIAFLQGDKIGLVLGPRCDPRFHQRKGTARIARNLLFLQAPEDLVVLPAELQRLAGLTTKRLDMGLRAQKGIDLTLAVVAAALGGYVLITAMWLLLLGGSIVALLMLRNLHAAEAYADDREQLQIRYAQESAVETVVADILFNGPRSEFSRLPAKTSYRFGDIALNISVTGEGGKIDVNQADVALIERVLRGLGIAALPRQNFVNRMKERQQSDRLFRSLADVEEAMQQAGFDAESGFYAEDYFTTYSGLALPQASQMDPRLALALGQASLPTNAPTSIGSAMRIMVQGEQGLPLVVEVRVSGLIGESHRVLDWEHARGCSSNGSDGLGG